MNFHLKTIISEDKDERGESTLLKPPFSSQKKNYTLEAPFCGIVAAWKPPIKQKYMQCLLLVLGVNDPITESPSFFNDVI